jgi:hypothetical protein
LTFNTADQVTLSDSSTALLGLGGGLGLGNGTGIAHMQALHVSTIDLTNNAGNITDTQAQGLINAGIHFAASDTGVVDNAVGTHLQNSVHDLHTLGVSTIDGQANSNLVVNLASSTDHTTTLQSEVDSGLQQFGTTGGGVSTTHVAIAVDSAHLGNIDLGYIATLESHGVNAIDIVNATTATTTAVELTTPVTVTATAFTVTDELANVLMNAGLLTAPESHSVTVDVVNTAGAAAMTLTQMGNLGVDHVVATGADVVLSLGVNQATHQDASITDLINTLSQLAGHGMNGAGSAIFDSVKNVELDLGHNIGFTDINVQQAAQLKLLGIDTLKDDAAHGGVIHTL